MKEFDKYKIEIAHLSKTKNYNFYYLTLEAAKKNLTLESEAKKTYEYGVIYNKSYEIDCIINITDSKKLSKFKLEELIIPIIKRFGEKKKEEGKVRNKKWVIKQ